MRAVPATPILSSVMFSNREAEAVSDDALHDSRSPGDEPVGRLETDWIDWLTRRASRSTLPVPLGDDAAVTQELSGRQMVFATDLLAEGVHFERSLPSERLSLVGQKSVGVNLSDLAAMGARAAACLVAVAIPADWDIARLRALYDGIDSICNRFEVELIGGDTNVWHGGLVVSTTAIGHVAPGAAWRRDGGRPGDLLVVTGPLGGSRRGKHWCAEPRLKEAARIGELASVHAAIDISDGLSLDLWRLAKASRCGASLSADAIPVSKAAVEAARRGSGKTALEHALADGEDFELLLALPPDAAKRLQEDDLLGTSIDVIGRLESEPGLWLETGEGRRPLVPQGYVHGD